MLTTGGGEMFPLLGQTASRNDDDEAKRGCAVCVRARVPLSLCGCAQERKKVLIEREREEKEACDTDAHAHPCAQDGRSEKSEAKRGETTSYTWLAAFGLMMMCGCVGVGVGVGLHTPCSLCPALS